MVRLRPMDLKVQPVPYQDRIKIIEKIQRSLEKYTPNRKDLGNIAIKWEFKIANKSRTKQGYNFNASVLLRDIIKYKGKLNSEGKYIDKKSFLKKDEVIEKLKTLILDKDILIKNGYIMETYNYEDIDDSSNNASKYVICSRCLSKFRKDEIMMPTNCQYHPLKKKYNKKTRTEEYPCCGELMTSQSSFTLGCQNSKYHVYKMETVNELSETIKFKKTDHIDGDYNVLALDCEMAYTSYGYEMIRLTIVDFWTKKMIFDEIVQPNGEIIDLNSQFSGVHQIDKDKSMTFQKVIENILNEKCINKNSILIGHGLENDLNVLRLIHNKIIDTAILYPAGKFKSSLKNLAFHELSRRIQIGEHDSTEDAIATMDVIKHKIGVPLDQIDW